MEEQEYKHNLHEWIISVNKLLREMKEEISNIALAQEEDLLTLSYQYKIIKDLRKRVNSLEYSLRQRKEVKYGNISKKSY